MRLEEIEQWTNKLKAQKHLQRLERDAKEIEQDQEASTNKDWYSEIESIYKQDPKTADQLLDRRHRQMTQAVKSCPEKTTPHTPSPTSKRQVQQLVNRYLRERHS